MAHIFSGWWAQYQGQSIGKMIHFIYCYCGLSYAEDTTYGENSVTYRGKPFAKVSWEVQRVRLRTREIVDVDVPVFEFLDAENKKFFTAQQLKHRDDAIQSLNICYYADDPKRRPKLDTFHRRY